MDTIELQTSSEEDNDDDGYLNSVAKLKVLKKQSSSTIEKKKVQTKNPEPQEELSNLSSTTPTDSQNVTTCSQRTNRTVKGRRRYKTRSATSKKKQQLSTQNEDSDLEIVSVEKPPVSHRISTKDDLEIVEIETDELNDDQIHDISIKILWRSRNVHRMNINENEKFEKIFQYFANLEGVSTNEILLMKKDRVIKKVDTPASINLSVIDILEGGIVQRNVIESQEVADEDVGNSSVIKVQTTNKKSLTMRVRRDEDFMALFNKCAEELNVDKSKIRMYFDGELVSVTDTPDSLDIEDEACFDFRLSS